MARDSSTPRRSGRNGAARRAAKAAAACAPGVAAPSEVPPRQESEPEDDLLRVVEAMLFAAHESLSAKRIARAIGFVTEARIAEAIATLARRCDSQRSPLMLAEIAGGWRLVTRPEYAPFLARLFSKAEKERLSQAALETLAIVAYRQPATRAEIEAVRGVLVAPLLRILQERRLIKVVGRAEVVGRPMQYGTTKRFLDHFGLGSIEDLPKVFPAGRPLPAAEAPAPETNGALTNGTNGTAATLHAAPEGEAPAAAPAELSSEPPAPVRPPPRIEPRLEGDAAPMALAAEG
jgi:segregation and condensation protein B